MARYIISEEEQPLPTDYFYFAAHARNSKIPNIYAHTHNFYEIYFYLSGEVRILIDEYTFNVKQGDVLIIPPNHIHNVIPIDRTETYERMYLYLTETCLSSFHFNKYSLLQPLIYSASQKKFHYTIDDPNIFNRIKTAINMIGYNRQVMSIDESELENRGHILEAMSLVNRYIISDSDDEKRDENSSFISQIISYINENYMNEITIENLCEKFYTNHNAITKLFKEYTTMTIHNYILLTRISRAKLMLSKQIPANIIYEQCGFREYSTFYRAFIKVEGISPKNFMELSQKSFIE